MRNLLQLVMSTLLSSLIPLLIMGGCHKSSFEDDDLTSAFLNKKEELSAAYERLLRLKNCDFMIVPQMNESIWKALNKDQHKGDLALQGSRENCKGITAIL